MQVRMRVARISKVQKYDMPCINARMCSVHLNLPPNCPNPPLRLARKPKYITRLPTLDLYLRKLCLPLLQTVPLIPHMTGIRRYT
jgi:hypothetical protein